MLQLSIIFLISHRDQKKVAETWGETPRKCCRRATRVVLKKSIIDKVNIIGSDGSPAGVEEETALVCRQRR